MSEVRVKDGATLRHSRITSMLAFISLSDNGEALIEIQSYMLDRFGLKFSTTGKYIKECSLARFLVERQGRWLVTKRYKNYSKL